MIAGAVLLLMSLFGGGPYGAVARLDDTGTTPSWRWLAVGMTRAQVEEQLGDPLVLSDVPDNDQGCEQYGTTIRVRGQQVYLDFDGTARSSLLISFTLVLKEEKESLDLADLREAVRSALPRAKYRPPPGAPDTKEAQDPRPTYTLIGGMELRIDAGLGVTVGRLCGS